VTEPGYVLLPIQPLTLDDLTSAPLQLLHAQYEPLPETSLFVPSHEVVRIRVHFALPEVAGAEATADGAMWRVGFHDNLGNGYEIRSTWKDGQSGESKFIKTNAAVPQVKAGSKVLFTVQTQKTVQREEDPTTSE
jgi:hypothetical protein